MPLFFHDLRHGQCKFIIGRAAWRFSATGIEHDLATACGKSVTRDGAAYCAEHAAQTAGIPAKRYPAPVDRQALRPPPAREDREPDLCEMVRAS